MVQIAAATVFALTLARVLRAPRGSWRYILGAAAAAMLATQFLPEGHPLRADVAESSQNLAWLAVAMVPVAAYGLWVRRLRLRTGVDRPAAPASEHPRGLVQIRDDAALAAETRATLDDTARGAGVAPETISLAWRGDHGELEGHLRLRLVGAQGEVEMLHVEPDARRHGIGTALIAAAQREAQAQGVRSLTATVGSWQALPFFTANGFRPIIERDVGNGQALHVLEKTLT